MSFLSLEFRIVIRIARMSMKNAMKDSSSRYRIM